MSSDFILSVKIDNLDEVRENPINIKEIARALKKVIEDDFYGRVIDEDLIYGDFTYYMTTDNEPATEHEFIEKRVKEITSLNVVLNTYWRLIEEEPYSVIEHN